MSDGCLVAGDGHWCALERMLWPTVLLVIREIAFLKCPPSGEHPFLSSRLFVSKEAGLLYIIFLVHGMQSPFSGSNISIVA